MTRLLTNLRRNPIPYLALLLVLVVGAGGGYALAASKTKTITVCADKKTGVLHLHNHGRCKRGQTRVRWNQRGPQGLQGSPGPAGQPGPPAATAWAIVAGSGAVLAGHGISVQRTDVGTYQLTVIAAGCVQAFNAPIVTVSDSNPPSGGSNHSYPTAWVGDTGTNQQFTVNTGVVVAGSFDSTDRTFNVVDICS